MYFLCVHAKQTIKIINKYLTGDKYLIIKTTVKFTAFSTWLKTIKIKYTKYINIKNLLIILVEVSNLKLD